MLRNATVRAALLRTASLALFCLGCESGKTLEPVRANGINLVSAGTLQGIVSSALADSLVVKVVDQRGAPMRNAQVSWTVTDGSVTPTSTTNDNGEARAQWTLGPALGQQVATARAGTFSVQVTANSTGIWRTIHAGYEGACGVTKSNTAYCWGANEAGQLGTGAAGNPAQSRVPTSVTTTQKFQDVQLNYAHVCGVNAAGAAFCWGLNGNGQVGVSIASTARCASANAPCTTAVTPVPGGLTFSSVSVGFYHSCGLTRAGKAYCWGRNTEGQLGLGALDGSEHSAPAPVATSLTFTSLSAGFAYTCGVTDTNQGYCWGNNFKGELGIGRVGPTGTPTLVTGGLTFSSIAPGAGFTTCGITVSQRTYCWGSNESGQLGANSTDSIATSPVLVAGNQTFASVNPGVFHTCALTTAGAAYCWGADTDGQLGLGRLPTDTCGGTTATRCSRVPLAVVGGQTFINLSTNNFNTCGVTSLGGAFCWGVNNNGEIGNGTTASSNTPVQVSNPTGVPLP